KNYPVTINDGELTAAMRPTLERVAGAQHVIDMPKVAGSEDFSFYQHVVPGLFFFVGVTPPAQDSKTAAPNHSPLFYVDEAGLPIGPAVYGAISGQRGGFFTIGGEAAWRQRLIGPFGVEFGMYVGGGGGGGAPQGGGLMLRPHVDLLADLGSVALGVSLSHIEFPNGQISSTQWGLVLNVNDQ